jgi:hypothetical protein
LQSFLSSFQQDVCVIRHQGKGVDARFRTFGLLAQAIRKRIPACIVTDDTTLSDSPDDHMMHGSRRVKSRSSLQRYTSFVSMASPFSDAANPSCFLSY